jgi:hypothetical protein
MVVGLLRVLGILVTGKVSNLTFWITKGGELREIDSSNIVEIGLQAGRPVVTVNIGYIKNPSRISRVELTVSVVID